MTRINEEEYAYATARVRAVEIHLLDASRLDRLIEAPTVEDAVKQLAEARYGDGQDLSRVDWETLLDGEPARVQAFLAGIMPDPEVLDVFRIRTDYLNLKRLLKAVYQAQDLATIACAPGTVPVASLVRGITEQREAGLPPAMGKAMQKAMAAFGQHADPRDIDLVLDRACFADMADRVSVLDNEYLSGLIALLVDMANIRIAIRGRLAGEGREFFDKAVLTGGSIDAAKFRDVADKPVDVFLGSIRHTWFGEAAVAGMDGHRQGKGISVLERLLEDRLMEYVRKARYIAMGVEAMIGHLLAREAEIRNVRIVLTGKVNGLPQAEVRERLRKAYV